MHAPSSLSRPMHDHAATCSCLASFVSGILIRAACLLTAGQVLLPYHVAVCSVRLLPPAVGVRSSRSVAQTSVEGSDLRLLQRAAPAARQWPASSRTSRSYPQPAGLQDLTAMAAATVEPAAAMAPRTQKMLHQAARVQHTALQGCAAKSTCISGAAAVRQVHPQPEVEAAAVAAGDLGAPPQRAGRGCRRQHSCGVSRPGWSAAWTMTRR